MSEAADKTGVSDGRVLAELRRLGHLTDDATEDVEALMLDTTLAAVVRLRLALHDLGQSLREPLEAAARRINEAIVPKRRSR